MTSFRKEVGGQSVEMEAPKYKRSRGQGVSVFRVSFHRPIAETARAAPKKPRYSVATFLIIWAKNFELILMLVYSHFP